MIDLERFRKGDEAYFKELIELHGSLVMSVARSYGSDTDHEEDLFQESWRRIFQRRGSFKGNGSFRTWAYRVATNVCRSEYRRRRVRRKGREDLVMAAERDRGESEQATDPSAGMERRELQGKLHRALGELSPREHEAVTLRILEGRPPDEVARIMKVSKASVRSLIRHAVNRLRKHMQEQGHEMPGH